MLAELEQLGMQLARATAARALVDLAEPEPDPESEPAPAADPPKQPAPSPPCEPLASEQPAAAVPKTPRPARPPGTPRPIDPALLFIRLAAAIRELIAIEAHLADAPTTARGTINPALRADPRRAKLLEGLRIVTENHPNRTEELRLTIARADEELAADPDHTIEFPELLFIICESLGIEMDLARLPDEYLGIDPNAPDADPLGPPVRLAATPKTPATSPP